MLCGDDDEGSRLTVHMPHPIVGCECVRSVSAGTHTRTPGLHTLEVAVGSRIIPDALVMSTPFCHSQKNHTAVFKGNIFARIKITDCSEDGKVVTVHNSLWAWAPYLNKMLGYAPKTNIAY